MAPATTPRDFEGLKALLAHRRDDLPRRLQQVAAFAVEHPDEVAFGTAASIASLADVQPSTLVRFAKALGYAGFSDLQSVFRHRLLVFSLPGARDALLAQHRAIHAAVKAGDPAAARRAAMDHITYVERSMAEAERTGDWQRVSRLRLRQRAGDHEPQRKKTAAGNA